MAGAEAEGTHAGPSGDPQDGPASRQGRSARVDQHQNPLKKPLLNKVQERSRPVTRAEKKISQTWVYITTFVAVMGNLGLGFGLGYSSPIQEELSAALNLDVAQFSFFGSLITLGAMAGGLVSGHTADYCGRKGGLALSAGLSVGGFLLISVAQDTILLNFGRCFTGVAGGIVCYVVPTLIAEVSPRHMRGTLGTMQQLSLCAGIFLAYLVGSFLHWRFLALTGMIPGVVCLIGLLFIPESPRWLAKVDRAEDLEASLKKLRGKDHDVSQEMRELQASADSAKDEPQAQISDLLKPKFKRPLVAGFVLHLLQQITGINGVMLYSGAIFLTAGVSNAHAAALSLAFLQVVMTAISAGLMDRAGRRLLLLVSFSGMTVSLFFVGLSFYLRGFEDEGFFSSGMDIFIDILALAGLLVYIATFSIGLGPVPWILMAEIFPNQVKGIAGSTATTVNWSGAWVVTLTFNFLLVWSAAGTFWLFSAISLFGIIFVALYVPETRGKTLEQIEQSFK